MCWRWRNEWILQAYPLTCSVFDPAMKAMFGSITKTGKWKWELDLAAQRAGKQFVPEEEQPEVLDVGDEPRFGDDARPAMDDFDQGYQGDNGQDGNQFDQVS